MTRVGSNAFFQDTDLQDSYFLLVRGMGREPHTSPSETFLPDLLGIRQFLRLCEITST